MAGEELKVPVSIPVETNADEAADSVESLRDRIMGSTESIKAMSGTLRQLRGTSDEVKAAKAQLTTKIQAMQGAVSAASLKLVQQGTTYDAVAQKEKKFLEQKKKLAAEMKKGEEAHTKDRMQAMGAAIGHAGGPVASLKGKLDSLKAVMGESSGATGLLTLAAAGLVAAVAALVVGAGAGAVALGKFILTSANTARSANLLREAWSGTAKNASNLGDQVDALSNKVPTGKAALNDLAISLMKSKIGGQATVDAFNAVAQASAALGDEAGGKIKDFIERGRMMGRMRIDPREMLEGFGNLDFKDIAGALAKEMHVSVADATKALYEGRVKLGDGAKAIREAVERKFGNINLRKMLDLNVMSEKLHEKWASLTKDVNLEPLLKPLGELGKLFDDSTVTGKMLKSLVTAFGTGMVTAMTAAIPLAKQFFEGLVLGSMKAYLAFLQLKQATKGMFGGGEFLKDGQVVEGALYAVKVAAAAAVLAVAALGVGVAIMVAPFYALYKVNQLVTKAITGLSDEIKSIDWKATGGAVVDGLIAGLSAGPLALSKAVKAIATSIKSTFTGEMKIQSPSREMFALAKQIPAGTVGGIEAGTPAVRDASAAMADTVRGGAAGMGRGGASAGGGSPIALHVHVHTSGGASAAAVVSSPSFLASLTKAVEDLLVSQGIPVQS